MHIYVIQLSITAYNIVTINSFKVGLTTKQKFEDCSPQIIVT